MTKKKEENTQEELFQLTANRKQFELISRGLELLSRVRAGQLTYLRDELIGVEGVTKDYEALHNALEALHRTVFPQDAYNESNHSRKDCWECYDIQQVIRNGLSWSKYPEGDCTRSLDEPMLFGQEPHPYLMRWNGTEATRIRNQINKKYFLRDAFSDLIKTSDLQDGIEILKKWKEAYDIQEEAMAEARKFFGEKSYDTIMDSFKTPGEV